MVALSSEQSNQNSGTGQNSVGQGAAWRDINASIGGLDLSGFMEGFGSARSSATSTSGAVNVGDTILGGNKSRRQFGLVKILALFAGAAVLLKLYKKMRG